MLSENTASFNLAAAARMFSGGHEALLREPYLVPIAQKYNTMLNLRSKEKVLQ